MCRNVCWSGSSVVKASNVFFTFALYLFIRTSGEKKTVFVSHNLRCNRKPDQDTIVPRWNPFFFFFIDDAFSKNWVIAVSPFRPQDGHRTHLMRNDSCGRTTGPWVRRSGTFSARLRLPSQPLVPSSTPECFFMIVAFGEVLLCASVYELMTLLCPPVETHCQHSGSGAAKLQCDSDQWGFLKLTP